MICEGASRVDLIRQYGTLTPDRIIQEDYTSMARLRRVHGNERVENALAIMVIEASTAFESPIDKALALELAAEVHTTYYWLSLEDCFVILQQMRRKKLFGKLDLNKILVEFDEYCRERISLADNLRYNQHLAIGDKGGNEGGRTRHVRDILKPYKKQK